MVEAMANSVEDRLIDGLSFKLAPGASYITDRRSVTFHPQGSNSYSAVSGTKLIRIVLTGDSWMDPTTFRIMFDVRNNDNTSGHHSRPLKSPWSFFRRMRVLAGGQLVEDIDYYNRVHEMFSNLISKDSVLNNSAEGFGYDLSQPIDFYSTYRLTGIPPGQSQTVLFKPLSGILNQGKYLPLRYMPLTIELELVNEPLDPIADPAIASQDEFITDNTSTDWRLENVQVKVDMCTLDNTLDNNYAQILLSGKSLPINYNTWVSQYQSIAQQKAPTINVTRALTRLKSVFVSLDKDFNGVARKKAFRKYWNDFYSPAYLDIAETRNGVTYANYNNYMTYNKDGEFEFQLQIGSKLYPEYSRSEEHTSELQSH